MIAPSARMMLLARAPYAGQRLRKLRFLMTDYSLLPGYRRDRAPEATAFPRWAGRRVFVPRPLAPPWLPGNPCGPRNGNGAWKYGI